MHFIKHECMTSDTRTYQAHSIAAEVSGSAVKKALLASEIITTFHKIKVLIQHKILKVLLTNTHFDEH